MVDHQQGRTLSDAEQRHNIKMQPQNALAIAWSQVLDRCGDIDDH